MVWRTWEKLPSKMYRQHSSSARCVFLIAFPTFVRAPLRSFIPVPLRNGRVIHLNNREPFSLRPWDRRPTTGRKTEQLKPKMRYHRKPLRGRTNFKYRCAPRITRRRFAVVAVFSESKSLPANDFVRRLYLPNNF